MAFLAKGRIFVAAVVAVLALATGAQAAASCGKTGAGFEAWKPEFAAEAKSEGVAPRVWPLWLARRTQQRRSPSTAAFTRPSAARWTIS